jgi:hypothetical protein
MPSPLLLALRARAAAGGGGGGPPSLSRAFLLYRQDASAPSSSFALGSTAAQSGDHDHQQRRALFSLFGGGKRKEQSSSDDGAIAAANAAQAGETTTTASSSLVDLDAAFERLPRVFRPGAAAEQAVHDLGGAPSALADLLDGAGASLPWAASLPLTTLALKLALTPLSLRSAAVVRSNLRLWTEAAGLAEQRAAKAAHRQRQEEEEEDKERQGRPPLGPAHQPSKSGGGRFELASARVAVYGELRRQCGVPSPLWAVGNVAVQVPTFFYVAASVRAMAGGEAAAAAAAGGVWGDGGVNPAPLPPPPWPGFQTEGALWFPDLSLPAAVPILGGATDDAAASALAAAAAAASSSSFDPLLSLVGLQLAPGASAAALALPMLTTALSLLAIRRGVAAFGGAKALAALPGARASPLLRAALTNLPRLAYAAAAAAIYFKLQAAPAVLLHWLASLSYTLALQQAVARVASVRRAMGLPPPPQPAALAALRALSAAAASAKRQQGGPAAAATLAATTNNNPFQELKVQPTEGPIPEGAEVLTPQQFVARVRADQQEGQPDVLVVMAAHHSSRGDSVMATYCLDLALAAEPAHARALYARGQARSMKGEWSGAERDFVAAASSLASSEGGDDGDETRRLLRGQALYAAGGAAAGAGEHARALELYDEAARWWKMTGAPSSGRPSPLLGAETAAAAAASARHAPALLALARSRSLAFLGRKQEALDALDRALSAGQRASVTEGLRGLLQEARRRLLAAVGGGVDGGGGGGGATPLP